MPKQRHLISAFSMSFFSLISILGLSACADPWVPTGGWQGAVEPQCEAQQLEAKLSTMRPGDDQTRLIDAFFERCKSQLSRNAERGIAELFKLGTIKYEYQKSARAEKFEYMTREGLKVRGTFFMKPGPEKRPLVIVKCGVQCEDGSTTLSHILMNLYDEGPFHVLLVPSFTGATYERDNRIMPVGGFDEGRQIVQLAKWLQSSKSQRADRISEVHTVGVSLGGHAALFAALYGSHQQRVDGRPLIASAFAGCPAVDLENSVTTLFSRQSGIVGRLFMKNFWDQVSEVARFVPVLNLFVEDAQRKTLRAIPSLIERGALDYYQHATQRRGFNEIPLEGTVIRTKNELWKANRFQDVAAQVKIPVYVWAADDDRVVGTDQNSRMLADMQLDGFHFIFTERGNHCAFSDAYTWRSMGAVIRGLLVSNSPSLQSLRQSHVASLDLGSIRHLDPENDWISADSKRKRRVVQWRVVKGQRDLDLIFYGSRKCIKEQDAGLCEKGYSVAKVPYSNVGLTLADRPVDEVSAQALTRWLNANAWVWGARTGKLDVQEVPRMVEWTRFGQFR